MTERIRLSSVSTDRLETNWFKCFLCQEDTEESLLLSPPKDYKHTNDSYKSLASNIQKFNEINDLPIPLDVKRLDDGNGIENTLQAHKAKYHHLCRLKFSNTKLSRAQKRYQSKKNVHETVDSIYIRTSAESQAAKSIETISTCFLCDKDAPLSELRKAMTMKLNERISKCAMALQDKELLAKLSSGDVIAQNMKYHPSCLVALYNRERDLQYKSKDESSAEHGNEIHAIVLSELITYVAEKQRNDCAGSTFRLAELVDMYKERSQQLGKEIDTVHATRLKEQIIEKLPNLKAFPKGRDVLLVSEKEVGPSVVAANNTSHLSEAAEVIRNDIRKYKYTFSGSLSLDDMQTDIPPSLLELVSMIEHGTDIVSQLNNGVSKSDQAIAQLLLYNFHTKSSKDPESKQRHSTEHETPFCIYLGLLIYAKTRKRQLIDILYQYGLCISYKRVLEISTQMGDAVNDRYFLEGVVCPSVLRKDIFTTAAVDNIDHNPSSTTAKTSFHGTGISIFQHPSDDNPGTERKTLDLTNKPKSTKISELPDSYTNIQPAYLKDKPVPPIIINHPIKISNTEYLYQNIVSGYMWLNVVRLTDDVLTSKNVSWSSYHSSEKRGPAVEVSLTSLMPLFQEQSHSVATIKHSMDKVKEVVNFLNPGQTPVITADQPLYTLAKQIQWEWPLHYGEDRFVVMLGGLHIEMACFKLLRDILRDSGWTSALTEAEITSSGTADSYLSCSNISRTKQAHQITAACLFDLLVSAYEKYHEDTEDDSVSYNDLKIWCSLRETSIPQFRFWYSILNLELLVLSFGRLFRESDFELYKQTLSAIIPYFFGLDHLNYARWLPIHLRDMIILNKKHPQIENEFPKGNFTVRKSARSFSNISTDQAHEENNAIVKGDGGAIGLTEDPSALRRWMVAGPEISRLVNEFESESNLTPTKDERHHDDTTAAQKGFLEKVRRLFDTIAEFGNPFLEESSDLYKLDSKEIVDSKVSEISDLERLGFTQYDKFMNGFNNASKSTFYDPIKKNKFPLFSRQVKSESGSTKTKLANLKSDCNLFSRLFISCQSRQCDLEDFFKHENHSYPPSLSQNGKLNTGVKSQLMEILETYSDTPTEEVTDDIVIIDGAALVNAKQPGAANTFNDYAVNVIIPYILSYTTRYSRVDIVFDVYLKHSLKAETRTKRGSGVRRKVVGSCRTPTAWTSFLREDENKTELFHFLSQKIVAVETDKQLFVTCGEHVMTNSSASIHDMSPCNHEEADTRIFVHAQHAAVNGCNSITVISTYTDVVVIGISAFHKLGIQKLFVAFGRGKTFRYIAIHDIAHALGARVIALPFFHAFTGCDTVSAFHGKGKRSAWQTWEVFDDVTRAFQNLSNTPDSIQEIDIDLIDAFVVIKYDRTTDVFAVDEARFEMFARKQRTYESIPPTRAALIQHIKRAAYQAGHVWGQANARIQQLPSPGDWGWERESEECNWKPHWTSMNPIAASCQELLKCGCKKSNCSGKCKCYKSGLPCTALCTCNCEIE